MQVVHFHSSSLTNLIKCAVYKLGKAPRSLVDICLGMSLMLLLVFHKSSSGKEATYTQVEGLRFSTHLQAASSILSELNSGADIGLWVIEFPEFTGVTLRTLIY